MSDSWRADEKREDRGVTLPKAIAESEITIMGVRLRCYVLDNGKRVFNVDDVHAFFAALNDSDRLITQAEADEFAKIFHGVH